MFYTIQAPDELNIALQIPASKSISNRALIMQALTKGTTTLHHLSDCDDTLVLQHALHNMPHTIDIHGAGSAMRFLTAYLSIGEGEHILTGTARMQQRPIGILVDALRQLGATIHYEGQPCFPPLRIQGHPIEGGTIEIPGHVSSQFTTALLLIAPTMPQGLTLKLTGDISSRPYIDLTLCMMRDFHAKADWIDSNTIRVEPQPYAPCSYTIESDWTAASYWYALMALAPETTAHVQLMGLMDGSSQGDSVVKYLFSLLGIKTHFASTEHGLPTTITLHRQPCPLHRLDYNFTGAPDLAQTFVVCCALMDVKFHFKGLQTLTMKECNRIEALQTEMRKLGYVIDTANDDELFWEGERCTPSTEPIETYADHRMALAFAPAAFRIKGLRINHPEVVSKSYPHYWDDLQKAGFHL